MGQPYSYRFLAQQQAALNQTYTVPTGQRAIVKSVDIVNLGASGVAAALIIANVAFVNKTVPGPGGSVSWYGHHVVYHGETIKVVSDPGVVLSCMVSGYLLADP